ncbi:hypothetical protein K438DRAFT_1959417 [Mycena galopus ATCC 62051]|nr:hypothetical protein K438DRAFT_1959417 [Mycena galopus ATCC 62051]
MQCSPAETLPRSTPRHARRRAVCILPPPSVRLIPTRSSPDSNLLPYYHTTPTLEPPSIRPRDPPPPAPFVPSSELRLPPIDPRKSRRYCTDFGFARNRPPPPPPMYTHENSSSAGSTPNATYAETDSDASSFYHPLDLELDFPQPPASPALRRMQSSPLFTAEETDAVREFLRRRWGTQHTVKTLPPHLISDESPLSDYSWDAQSPDALELAGEQLLQAPQPVPVPVPVPTPAPRESWLVHMTPPNLNALSESVAPLRPRARCSVLPPNARVLRRAASMADPPTPLLLIETAPPVPVPARSLRFQDAPLPSLASAGRQKPTHHRGNLSVPLMGLGVGIPDVARPALGTAFAPAHPRPNAHMGHHRSARSQPDLTRAFGPRAGGPNPDPRSFIDLTPEKVSVQRASSGAHVHRERVKRLLSRASSGFIGWGKALAGKKVAHH